MGFTYGVLQEKNSATGVLSCIPLKLQRNSVYRAPAILPHKSTPQETSSSSLFLPPLPSDQQEKDLQRRLWSLQETLFLKQVGGRWDESLRLVQPVGSSVAFGSQMWVSAWWER